MALYRIDEMDDSGSGRIDSEGRLRFGGTTVEYIARRNRFLLSDPNRHDCSVFIFEADIPQFLAYFMKRFKPYGGVSRARDWNAETERLLKALCVAMRTFSEVRGWTSQYCTDCMPQRDRADKTREVLELIVGGDIELLLIKENPKLYDEGRDLADLIQEYVSKRKQDRRIRT